MFKRRIPSKRAFYGVALMMILAGAALVAVGFVQLVGVMFWEWKFGWPMAKIIGGLIVCSLGYIILILELLRQKATQI